MGLEHVQLLLMLEEELKIKIPEHAVSSLWEEHSDIQVSEFASRLEQQVRLQSPAYDGDTFQFVKSCISETTGIDESQINPSSWLFRDLDMG